MRILVAGRKLCPCWDVFARNYGFNPSEDSFVVPPTADHYDLYYSVLIPKKGLEGMQWKPPVGVENCMRVSIPMKGLEGKESA
jgi:hypothetical protein